jgi:hypothetical protein
MTRASHGRHEGAFTVIQALGLNRNTLREKIRDLDLRTIGTIRLDFSPIARSLPVAANLSQSCNIVAELQLAASP